MKDNKHFIKLLLNKDGVIVEFESTLRDSKYTTDEVLGKSWFDTFIDVEDKLKTVKIFNQILNNEINNSNTFENDIRCKDNSHKLIDFHNELVVKNGEKFISSFGIEHIDNI